ncbi:MAG: heparinase II/III family protein, partial [Candidatus Latescibacteria bacterium]|nr:heparinase II/III family protein [Candidatus Latescibacterota bacterium]
MSDRSAPVRYEPHPKRSEATDYVLSISEDDMLALVPEQAGLANTACPNCKGGQPNLANWAWTPERSREIRCEDCGEVYPGNPKYPDDACESVEAPDGEHRYPYYHPRGDVRLFFRAKADYLSREFISDACLGLAERFHEAGDEECARRAGLILLRCAEVYPTYAYHYQYPGRETQFSPWHQNRIPGVGAYRTTRWTGWAYMDVSQELVGAYDILRFWPGLKELGDGNAKDRIVDDLLSEMVKFVIGFEEQYTNMSPWMWADIVYAGRVLDRAKWIQEVLDRLDHFVTTSFLYDGHWMETSPSYCAQTVSYLGKVLRALDGYEPQQTGSDVAEQLAKIRGAIDACEALHRSMRFPNGTHPTLNDTWAPKARREDTEQHEVTGSLLPPGFGLAILGGGQGDDQIYAWLNFTSGRHHKHVDALSIGIFAFGRELLRDLGYTHSIGRSWATSLMCHNTVVVDGLNGSYDLEHQGHRLRTFVSDGRAFHLAEAESTATYPDTVRRYRRTLVLVGSDSRDAYLLDIFQVHGGHCHDYLLHGSADEDSNVDLSGVELSPFSGTLMNEGTDFVYPAFETPGEGDFGAGKSGDYGFIHDLKVGEAHARVVLDLRLSSAPKIGTRSTVLFPGPAEAYL